ncbi:hypothetical protein Tco_1059666 [Tanacetum coccineum]
MMANLSKDIQCAGSDTRPPMLDRSDFESWQQRIRLYCLGKDNGENILKSIDEGPFKMGKFRETLADGALGPKRDRVVKDLTLEEKERYKADIHATNILLQGSELTKDERESRLYDEFEHFRQIKGETIHEYYVRYTQHAIDPLALVSNVLTHHDPSQSSTIPQSAYVPPVNYQPQFANNTQPDSGLTPTDDLIENLTKIGRQNRGQGNYARGATAAGNGGVHNRVGNANPGQAKPIKCYNCTGMGHIARQSTHPKRPQNPKYFKYKMLLMQAQENGVVLDEEQLLFIAGGQTNMFDDDVDEAPVQDLALNEDNVFQADQCDSFDSDVDKAPTAQTMFMANLSSADPIYDDAGPSYDSDILSEVQDHDNYIDSVGEYHEYVKDNAVKVVQSNVSSVPNDALMMIINDMHEQAAQCVSAHEQNKVVNESLTAELARYKEQVELYEKRERFELTEREQKIDEQMRIIIRDRNVQEELLKKELHSVKMQLNSTINHNKLIKEEVTTLKKDFKQKQNKYLEEFLDMKQLKEKVEDKLYKQDQSLQTVHMLCKPKPFYDEKKKVAIGYKNPLYLTKAKQVQPALYNGHELVKTKHSPAIVHDSEDTFEIVETTRMKMLEKSKSALWVDSKIKISPPDYSKENYLATFTPQRQLTPD